MKASELIVKLQAIVAEHGDLVAVPSLDDDDHASSREIYDVLYWDHSDQIGIYVSLDDPREDGEQR